MSDGDFGMLKSDMNRHHGSVGRLKLGKESNNLEEVIMNFDIEGEKFSWGLEVIIMVG
jgi:hypothetical protein